MPLRPPAYRSALVFDLDGTLVESAPDLMSALNVALKSAGRPTLALDAVKSMIGDGVPTLVARGFEATGGSPGDAALKAAVDTFMAYYSDHAVDDSYAYQGAAEALSALREDGHRLAVCTNKPHAPALSMLDALELLPLFEVVVGGDSFDYRKPDARLLGATLSAMDSMPREAVMIGDSLNDAKVAHGMDVPFVLATFGYVNAPRQELAPAATFDHFDHLPACLSRLTRAQART